MSASGPISNYFVDSLLGPDSEDLLAPRFAGPGSARPAPLLPDCSDFPSCSFAPKPAVFAASWAPVPPQPSVGYPHPHGAGHYGPQAAEPRYVRTWLEPLAGAVSFPPFGPRPYGLKDAFGARRGECGPADGRAGYPELVYAAPGERAASGGGAGSPEPEAIGGGKHKEEKLELDPSKSRAILAFTTRGEGEREPTRNKTELPRPGGRAETPERSPRAGPGGWGSAGSAWPGAPHLWVF